MACEALMLTVEHNGPRQADWAAARGCQMKPRDPINRMKNGFRRETLHRVAARAKAREILDRSPPEPTAQSSMVGGNVAMAGSSSR